MKYSAVDFGVVKSNPKDAFSKRLHNIYNGVQKVIDTHKPDVVSVEEAFYSVNVSVALKLGQVRDVLTGKLTKRGIDVRCLEPGEVQKISGNKVKQEVKVKVGVETELAKKIVRLLKDSKLKVQASIQGDAVRVTGAKHDDLQAAMALIRKEMTDLPLSFNNFRD